MLFFEFCKKRVKCTFYKFLQLKYLYFSILYFCKIVKSKTVKFIIIGLKWVFWLLFSIYFLQFYKLIKKNNK